MIKAGAVLSGELGFEAVGLTEGEARGRSGDGTTVANAPGHKP